ncbi:hypothetical protein EON73_02055, partial [bacterium]
MSLSTLLPAKAIFKEWMKKEKDFKDMCKIGFKHTHPDSTVEEINELIDERVDKWRETFMLKMEEEQAQIAHIHIRMKNIVKPILEGDSNNDKKIKHTYFITVNPKPDVIFEEFKNPLFKYIKSKSILAFELVFEQKGEDYDSLGHNFHAHIIVRGNASLRKNHINERIQTLYGDMIGSGQPDTRDIFTLESKENRKNYIRDGKMNDPDKKQAHIMDK